jgi:hypothetical protein
MDDNGVKGSGVKDDVSFGEFVFVPDGSVDVSDK